MKMVCLTLLSCLLTGTAIAQSGWDWNSPAQDNPSALQMTIQRLEMRHRMIYIGAFERLGFEFDAEESEKSREGELTFRVMRPLSREAARRIVVDCLNEFERIPQLQSVHKLPQRGQLPSQGAVTIVLEIYGNDGLPAIAPDLGQVQGSTESITYGYRQCAYDVACTHFQKEPYREEYLRSTREGRNLDISRMPL